MQGRQKIRHWRDPLHDDPPTCVAPAGRFVYTVHRPRYSVKNLRQATATDSLGPFDDEEAKRNDANFPDGNVEEPDGEWIYEIPNAFPFRGTTYILKSWADARAQDRAGFVLPDKSPLSFSQLARKQLLPPDSGSDRLQKLFRQLPDALKLALAVNSTDPTDLIHLAEISCRLVKDDAGRKPVGIAHVREGGEGGKAVIADPLLFEAVANNPYLPDEYKHAMVLKPGIQGSSEIVGEWQEGASHVFEYLRRNSYIPWGHYAANMADDAVRYRIGDLTRSDMRGMRHLYYQRTFVRLAEALQIPVPASRRAVTAAELESLRRNIVDDLQMETNRARLPFSSTLWGWNFGFDFSPSGYRLHASHQQIHTQYALVPDTGSLEGDAGAQNETVPAYCCGDRIAGFIQRYRQRTGCSFFPALIAALRDNRRLDRSEGDHQSLVIYEDEQVMLFVPKAQTSQWELQLITLKPVGNILEADASTRRSLDDVLLAAMQTLEAMGARMIAVIEYAKRFVSEDSDQRLLYVFLPRLPQSPGAFSEAQLRWISGHYPEDFAAVCRAHMPPVRDADANPHP
jgi:hypothetical protein